MLFSKSRERYFLGGNLTSKMQIYGGNFFQIIELFEIKRPQRAYFGGKSNFLHL